MVEPSLYNRIIMYYLGMIKWNMIVISWSYMGILIYNVSWIGYNICIS